MGSSSTQTCESMPSDEELETENPKRKKNVQYQQTMPSTIEIIDDLWINTFSRYTTEGRYYKVLSKFHCQLQFQF